MQAGRAQRGLWSVGPEAGGAAPQAPDDGAFYAQVLQEQRLREEAVVMSILGVAEAPVRGADPGR
ncbi:MAG TPA: hypothetical protein VFH45_13720 [Acidimicrobiales bacterium]|nr:hypothetical protein [Acidimicrobiales bacterium]